MNFLIDIFTAYIYTDGQKSGYVRLHILLNPYLYIPPHMIPVFRMQTDYPSLI